MKNLSILRRVDLFACKHGIALRRYVHAAGKVMQFAKDLDIHTLAAEIKVATCEAVAQRLISGIVFEELLTGNSGDSMG